MEDKLDEVIKRYPFNVKSRRRIRGAVLLDTDKGIFLAKIYTSCKNRLIFEESIKKMLVEGGCCDVDIAIENINDELLTDDGVGNKWLVKRWYSGEECDIRDIKKVVLASANMAKLHEIMVMGEKLSEPVIEIKPSKMDIQALFSRHNREIKRVHGYIREKRQKNDMEICLLNSYKNFYEQGKQAEEFLAKCGYDRLCETTREQHRIFHGSYNYHNIILIDDRVVTTNFEKADIGIQISDLYDFLRKVMEKNSWQMEFGISAIEAYCKVRQPEEEERMVLYAMLLYPEKYWKLINFYYNGKKSWMSAKNYEKLLRICKQEEVRIKFLKEVKKLLI